MFTAVVQINYQLTERRYASDTSIFIVVAVMSPNSIGSTISQSGFGPNTIKVVEPNRA